MNMTIYKIFLTSCELTILLWLMLSYDRLEVGNGGCSYDEYVTHFSLWAVMKAPLIIGNDVRQLQQSDPIMQILSNKEMIAVNQDPLGRQARRVWSDRVGSAGNPDHVTATKCSTGVAGAYEDAVDDQRWSLEADGTIKSQSTGMCLLESRVLLESEHGLLETANTTAADKDAGLYGVSMASCDVATRWDVGQYVGGSVVSKTTGRCLEVARIEYIPLLQGKRVQTAVCQHTVRDKGYVDIREHQSWTSPSQNFLNLYQVRRTTRASTFS